MKKKFLALMLSLTMVMSVTACGGSNDNTKGSSSSASNDADTPDDKSGDDAADDAADEPVDESTEASEGELVYNEANGLLIGLPTEFTAADGGVEGLAVFANADNTAFITVSGPVTDNTTEPEQLTEEAFASMFEAGGYSDVTVDNAGVVAQPDGATTATGFGTGTMPQDDGNLEMNIVMRYYFMADGSGVYIINYAYPLDDTATDDIIADILASVTVE